MNAGSTFVMVAVDGTPRSAGALRYAVQEARASDAILRIVHVGPDYTPTTPYLPYAPRDVEAEGHTILREAEEQVVALAPDLDVVTELRRGPRAGGIVAAAEGAEVVVVGRETRGPLERLVTGATTAKVAARSDSPVVVVPSTWEPTDPKGRVVVGVKSPDEVDPSLARAFEVAAAKEATLVLVHAWQLPEPYADAVEQRGHPEEWIAHCEQTLRDQLADLHESHPQVELEIRVVHGPAVDALAVAGQDADLVLLLRRSDHRLPMSHLGGTARRVLQLSGCPVEVLPPAGARLETPDLLLEDSGQLLK